VLRTKQRRLLFIAALVVVLCVVLFVALSEAPPVAVTADGRRIAIEKITFGTHHSFTQGKWWVRLLKPIRGKSWAARRGCYEIHLTNDVPALTVWTRWEGLHPLNARVAEEATVVDENGIESEFVLNRWNALPGSLSGDPGPQHGCVAWIFNNFPRRTDKIRLRIYDRDKRYVPTRVVEIAFSNPTHKRIAEWRGSAPPVVITTNNTQFSLIRVQQASEARWRFNFVVRTNGQPDRSWIAGGITASSASGNVFSTRSNLAATVTTNIAFQLRGAFWPEEPVWRLATEFFRTADFQSNELWTLTNVAIPARALPFQFTTNFISHGNRPAEFKLESIPLGMPSRPQGIRRNANVYIHFGAPGRHIFLAEATDDQGREIRVEVDPGAPRMVYQFGLAIPAGAQSLNLTFAICRPTIITFGVTGQSFTRVDRE
jgi:hypothetical protein